MTCDHRLFDYPDGSPCTRTDDHEPGHGCVYKDGHGSDLNDIHGEAGHG
jgi:hypothetical protein